jgi:hypothetical protein
MEKKHHLQKHPIPITMNIKTSCYELYVITNIHFLKACNYLPYIEHLFLLFDHAIVSIYLNLVPMQQMIFFFYGGPKAKDYNKPNSKRTQIPLMIS